MTTPEEKAVMIEFRALESADDLTIARMAREIVKLRTKLAETIECELAEHQAAVEQFSKADSRRDRVANLRKTLTHLNHELTIPAAEYVPAIPACWEIIKLALAADDELVKLEG